MALIGQIAISMTTDARQFNAGLAQAQARLRNFSKLAATLGRVSPLTGIGIGGFIAAKGLNQAAAGFKAVAAVGGAGMHNLGQAIKQPLANTWAFVRGQYALVQSIDMQKVSMAALTGGLRSVAAGLGGTVSGLGVMAFSVARVGVGLAGWGLGAVVRGFGAFTGVVREAVNHLGRFAAVAGVVVGYGLAKIVTAAADVTEALNLVQVQFGSASGVVVKEAERMSAAFGISKREYLDMAGQFSVKLQGLGMSPEKVAELSNVLAMRAIDVESQRNLQPGEASTRMLSGLSGDMEAVRRLGVNMEEARIKAQAYAMGLGKAGVELTQEEKQHARIAILLAGTAKAAGDRAKTAGEVKNAWREVQGRVVSLAETIGGALEPVSRSVIGQMGTALGALQLYWNDNQNAVASWASSVVGGSSTANQSLGIVQQSIGFLADAWQAVGLSFAFTQTKITEGLIGILGELRGFGYNIANTFGVVGDVIVSAFDFKGTAAAENRKAFTEMTTNAGNFRQTWLEDLKRLKEEQQKTFQTKLAKPPASEAVNDYFDKARAKAEALRNEITKRPVVSPDVTTGGVPKKAKKAKEVKFASALIRGTSQEASTVLRSRYSGGKTADEQKKISANTAKANEHLSKIAAAVVGGQSLMFLENI